MVRVELDVTSRPDIRNFNNKTKNIIIILHLL